jgi:hypothetical protein
MDMFSHLNAAKYEEPVENSMINIEDLYNRQHSLKLAREENYQKILNRIHSKIKLTARTHIDQKFMFYVIPEIMIGVPRYNVQHCTAYVINKLQDNGFFVRYTHPNLLFISWQHYIPKYEREMIQQTHGIKVDEFGNELPEDVPQADDPMDLYKSNKDRNDLQNAEIKKSEYNNTKEYEPLGIYGKDILLKMNKKLG